MILQELDAPDLNSKGASHLLNKGYEVNQK